MDKKTLEIDYERHELSATKALEFFLDALDGDCNSTPDFRRLKAQVQELELAKASESTCQDSEADDNNVVPIRRAEKQLKPSEFTDFVKAIFRVLPPGIIIDNWYRGRLYHQDGLTAQGQRAD